MHVDTGHNFPEVLEFRDRRVRELGEQLIVASVQESIDTGRVAEETGGASRNRLQTVTLLDAIAAHGFDAAFGGARRDEERARAKERDLLLPRRARPVGPARASGPSCGTSTTAPIARGEHVRVFPLSNWTELDVWRYIGEEELELPTIYFAHEREVFERDGMLLAVSEWLQPPTARRSFEASVRYRTVGDMTITGAVESDGRRRRGRDRRDGRHAADRARPDPRRRPHVARPPWRTASARATSMRDARPAPPRHRRLGRRRQVDPDRPAAATTPSR